MQDKYINATKLIETRLCRKTISKPFGKPQ